MSNARALAAAAAIVALVSALTACSRVGYRNEVPQSAVTCEEVSASLVQRVRADDTSSPRDRDIEFLADNCPDAYEITIDYISSRSIDLEFRFETCAEWRRHIRAESVELLRADGLCSDAASADTARGDASGGLPWDAAGNHVGTTQRVCGPLVTTRSDGDDVFLNLGRDYPDPARFTIVLWDIGQVESLPAGTTICATGTISLYNGVAQIELNDVGPVEVWE